MIRIAERKANESVFSRARHGAVIVKGRRVLATGTNQIRGYQASCTKKWECSLHAEQDAILKLLKSRRLHHLNGSTIYISRVSPSGRTLLSKPCPVCQELIQAVGIKKVVYTNNEGGTNEYRT